MDKVYLCQDYRLIERNESEVNGAWKGAHLLLFFMAFVFGSFCTFCFHMLMYLFDEKCVLFPRLQSLTSLRHNVIYEFIPVDNDDADNLPVDFLSTQWLEKSACYLPTYVPLVSSIFGLVWTTMFLMCSSGSRTLTGLQRTWRVLPPVFVFSLAMGCLCIYSSCTTHYGLYELCLKLGEITGSKTCTYTVNVATLTYERRIRGVYQAIRLTITSAWLHTICWLLSALLAMLRVLLAVDFKLIRVNVELVGNIDRMLERHEGHLRTVSPDLWINDDDSLTSIRVPIHTPSKVHFQETENQTEDALQEATNNDVSQVHFISDLQEIKSLYELVDDEHNKITDEKQGTSQENEFIARMVQNLIQNLNLPTTSSSRSLSLTLLQSSSSETWEITRQYGQEHLHDALSSSSSNDTLGTEEAENIAKVMRRYLLKKIYERLFEIRLPISTVSTKVHDFSTLNITDEMRQIIESNHNDEEFTESKKQIKKSNLKHASAQTDNIKRLPYPKVKITVPASDEEEQPSAVEKATQTSDTKEKQD